MRLKGKSGKVKHNQGNNMQLRVMKLKIILLQVRGENEYTCNIGNVSIQRPNNFFALP
jgi:hypothetical protein